MRALGQAVAHPCLGIVAPAQTQRRQLRLADRDRPRTPQGKRAGARSFALVSFPGALAQALDGALVLVAP
ncbi:hypothetical protein BN2497_12101 [Janthinobacterium sp. CG23_2]|nr:hypothetical protein BN2497_12101 [Janthinobacterium sp. CG23_2]CUU32448.1 hypothetical protein BN3177_12101 [Janthinobacterium sp. CG23_2]